MKVTTRTPAAAASRILVSPAASPPWTNTFDDLTARHYELIVKDPRYEHFVRIPSRIVRSLDFFGVRCQKAAVERRLRAYYLFIGVIDNAIDSHDPHTGESVLHQLESKHRFENFNISEITLATDHLRLEISDEIRPDLIGIMRALSRAVGDERTAGSMREYIQARKRVGQLTARASYVLIRPLLSVDASHVRRFMEDVGEIGCLVDSVIDLHADLRSGLLNFRITVMEFMRLLTCTIKNGAKLSIKYPQLLALFAEAIADNLSDNRRARMALYDRQPPPTPTAPSTRTTSPRSARKSTTEALRSTESGENNYWPFCKIDSPTVE